MTRSSFEKLKKFFKLEAERGFDNRAVVGGLDKILASWEAEAHAESLPEEWIKAVNTCLHEYPTLEPEARGESLKSLWRLLQISREENPLPSNRPRPEKQPAAPAEEEKQNRRSTQPQRRPIRPRLTPPESELPSAPAELSLSRHPTSPDRNHHQEGLGLNAPLTVVQGIGPRHAETLENLNLHTLGDMLYYYPRRYDDYSQLKTINRLKFGEEVTVIAQVQSINIRPIRGGQSQLVEAIVSDGSGSLRLNWFNQPWLINNFKSGMHVSISGKVEQFLGRMVMTNPECDHLDQEQLHTNRIVPVYPLTARITQHWLRKMMYQVVTYWAPRQPDYLPASTRQSAGLVDLPVALSQVHFPSSQDHLKAARDRLAFDEIFFLQLGVLRQKQSWQAAVARIYDTPDEWLEAQVAGLPFSLTGAQQKALNDLRQDLVNGRPMNRLLQGDVGSGKTVIAALGVAMVARHGAQSAMMAPTGILAEQHYRNMLRLLTASEAKPDGVMQPDQIRLLVGDTSEAEKAEIRSGLETGAIKLVIGTHALIEEPVRFENLQFIVVDEQHRFGVAQRATLRSKGDNPHLLVMTATPIPRSLALTVYGDLDITVLDELPAGRQVIETHVLYPRERERAYSLIRSQTDQGYQAFIIYPLVEQGEKEEAIAAVEEHARLQNEIFPRLALGLLHGRLKPEEKEAVMAGFRDGYYQIVVSTSVVEVGVDVPNATVMLIEGANRFGLAQLHQFRGRVGRGTAKSFCLLIPDDESAIENERLAVMAQTNDGFVLAEKDLEQRGPGDFLGTRQSGFADLRMANLMDVRLIEKARKQAQAIFENDPNLTFPEHQPLVEILNRYWNLGQGDIS